MTLGTHRLRVLRHARFRRFLLGQSTSLLGSGMNTIATTFAVLRLPGGGVDAVGGVMAARILAVLVVLLLGGVLTDRIGARTVMLASDLLRFGSQGVLAVLLLTQSVRIWEVVVLAVALGIGEEGSCRVCRRWSPVWSPLKNSRTRTRCWRWPGR